MDRGGLSAPGQWPLGEGTTTPVGLFVSQSGDKSGKGEVREDLIYLRYFNNFWSIQNRVGIHHNTNARQTRFSTLLK